MLSPFQTKAYFPYLNWHQQCLYDRRIIYRSFQDETIISLFKCEVCEVFDNLILFIKQTNMISEGFKLFKSTLSSQMAVRGQPECGFEVISSVQGEEQFRISESVPARISGKEEVSLDRLPAKVLQNCQRTGRVVIISELEKRLSKNKKYKMELCKILSQFVPKTYDQEGADYSESKKYYQSLNYSRVRIGHKQFIKKILNNSFFQKPLVQIFDSETLYNSQKARKNQRSPISFEQRKKILQKVLLDYKSKFICLNQKQECYNETSTALDSSPILEEKEEPAEIIVAVPHFFPLVPVALTPAEYQLYMAARK